MWDNMNHSARSFLGILILISVVAFMSGCCCCITGSGSPASATSQPAEVVKKDVDTDQATELTQAPLATSAPSPAQQTSKMGTRTNPVPVGTLFLYNPTATSSNLYGSTAKITLLEVVKGEEANLRLKQINEYYEPTNPSTDDFLMAKFRFEIQSADTDKTFIINRHDFKAANDAGTKLYDPSYVTLDPKLDGELANGGSHEGWIVLECGKTDTAPMIVYDQGVDVSGGVWFKTST